MINRQSRPPGFASVRPPISSANAVLWSRQLGEELKKCQVQGFAWTCLYAEIASQLDIWLRGNR